MKTFREKLLVKGSAKETFREGFIKAQSAMEYLMTYGWAILIISVVLAALFQLGVFNPMTFAPKAPPGSCQVFRPNGPGTTNYVSLQGTCGYLPMYVASFDGSSGYVGLPTMKFGDIYTFALWAKPQSLRVGSNPADVFIWLNWQYCGDYAKGIIAGENNNGNLEFKDCGVSSVSNSGFALQASLARPNVWYFLVGVRNNTSAYFYINGNLVNSISGLGSYGISNNSGILSRIFNTYYNNSIANVQIYNAALTPQEIQYLYQEGIGGAPIDLQHLVGWWPLNGNANDYSGNGNNGQINGGVTFVSNWYSDYMPP